MRNTIPAEGFLRLNQIIGKKSKEGEEEISAIIPVSKSTWWNGVKTGRFPKPVKLSTRCTAWRAADIRALINGEAA